MRECPFVRPACASFAAIACAVLLFAAGANSPENDFQFAIVGDRTGEAVAGVYERVLSDIAPEHPAFVVSVGDTIQGGDDHTARAEWRQLRPLWKRMRVPWFFAPGNHDVWSAASARIYTEETGHPLCYSFDWKNAHFTILDNSRTDDLSPAQLSFLESDLARLTTRGPRFVVFHRSFWWVWLRLQNTNFELQRIARKFAVTAVISGHVHEFDRMEQDGVTYLMVCSSGGHLRDTGPGWFFGHVLATVHDGHVAFTVHKLP